MIIWLFTYAMWPVNAKKKRKNISIAVLLNTPFKLPEKTPCASVKSFLRYLGVFAKLTLSIGPIFNLHNLKGNGNAANDIYEVLSSSDRPVGSTQRSGACTGRRAAGHVSRPGRSWRTRRRAGPAWPGHSAPEGPSGSGYPDRKSTERLLPETRTLRKVDSLECAMYSNDYLEYLHTTVVLTIQWAPANSCSKLSKPIRRQWIKLLEHLQTKNVCK